MTEWTNVNKSLPLESNSIFKRFYGTDKWNDAMWRTQSDKVLVTVVFPDKTRTVCTGETHDGTWKTSVSQSLNPVVTHWMNFPAPAKEDDDD